MKTILTWVTKITFLMVAINVYGQKINIDDAMPCEKKIKAVPLTKVIVPMTPFRGVNLHFPFELNKNNATYSLSSNLIWNYTEAQDSKIMPVSFAKFKDEWGEIHDLTISANGYVFSIALVAVKGNDEHCTNVIFELTEAELAKIKEREKKDYLTVLKQEYDEKLAALDNKADLQALTIVGQLVKSKPSRIRIKEEDGAKLSNGDELVLYVDSILGYGKFSVMKIELENDSRVNPLYIKSVTLLKKPNPEAKGKPIKGHSDYDKKMEVNSVQTFTFSTLENISSTGATLLVSTDQGDVEVSW